MSNNEDREPVPVRDDEEPIEEGGYEDPEAANTDAQLEKDDKDAIDESNIIEERTRGAAPDEGYREPGDDEGIPTDDGTSAN